MITPVKEDNSFNVPSNRIPGKFYNVAFDKHKQEFNCECMHWSLFQTPCSHIRDVIQYCVIKYRKLEKNK